MKSSSNVLRTLAARCEEEGVRLTIVLPPMAENVRTEVCAKYGIDTAMTQTVLLALQEWGGNLFLYGFDYEWDGSCIQNDDTPVFLMVSTWTNATACPIGPANCWGYRRSLTHRTELKEMALDFLILYEHTVREYESDLLLKLELERRGYRVEIRQLLDPKY